MGTLSSGTGRQIRRQAPPRVRQRPRIINEENRLTVAVVFVPLRRIAPSAFGQALVVPWSVLVRPRSSNKDRSLGNARSGNDRIPPLRDWGMRSPGVLSACR